MAVPKKIAEKVSVLSAEIRYSGIFDFDGLYKMMHKWLQEHYEDVFETPYKHKMTGKGAEIEFSISGERKQTEFVKFQTTVDIHIWDLRDIEMTKEGKKQKLNKGRFTLIVKGVCIFDWQKQFEGKPLYIRLFNLLRNTILKTHIAVFYLDTLYYEAYKLHTEIKKFLGMETGYSAF